MVNSVNVCYKTYILFVFLPKKSNNSRWTVADIYAYFELNQIETSTCTCVVEVNEDDAEKLHSVAPLEISLQKQHSKGFAKKKNEK